MRRLAAMLGALLAVASATAAPADSGPRHPGPPVYAEVRVDDRGVTVEVTGEQNSILHWLAHPADPDYDPDVAPEMLSAPLTPAQRDRLRAGLRRFFGLGAAADDPPSATWTIDGEAVDWTIRDIHVPADEDVQFGVPALRFSLWAPRSSPPRRVGVVWREWRRLGYFGRTQLPVMFRSLGDGQLAFVGPEEPSYVWHASSVVPPVPPQLEELEAPRPARLELPLLSLAAGVAGLLVLPLLWTRRLHPAAVGLFVAGMAATAWLGRDAWVRSVPDPFAAEVVVPDADTAAALFGTLHRNIYRAFDAHSEQEIYQLLARSVTPNLLDELYGEIFESLVMRGEGGAVCEVERYEKVSGEVDRDPETGPWDAVPEPLLDRPRFDVLWEWRIHGVVSHWGHLHRRVNHYRAEYAVVHDGSGWRIADVEIVDHERVDSDPALAGAGNGDRR